MKVAAVLLLAMWTAEAGELRYKPAPAGNPLKGFIAAPGSPRDDFPFSMAYAQFSLASFEAGWDGFEKRLDSIAEAGRHAVVRVYVEWPGRTAEPDYNDPAQQASITNFIAEFGKRYDGDARIGFIEAGLLGSWGEWIQTKKTPIPEELKTSVISAYAKAFQTTKILARWPSELTVTKPVGYHDDWFGHTRQFGEKLAEFPLRSAQPIGGRIHPRFADCLWNAENRCGPSDEEFASEVRRIGFTYLRLPGTIKRDRERALDWSRALGYELQVTRAEIQVEDPNRLSVLATITNRGVAPFYYQWPVELLIYVKDDFYHAFKVDWDIRTVAPGQAVKFGHVAVGQHPGSFKVLMRVANPLPKGQPLRFANEEKGDSPEGWVTIGEITRE